MKPSASLGGLIVTILLVGSLSGCAAWTFTKSLFVTGVSLDVLGEQFASVSAQVTTGCASQAIPKTTCDKYRVFGENFKRVYPVTVGVWKAANKAGDTTTQRKAEDVAVQLSTDLATLAAEALNSFTTGAK